MASSAEPDLSLLQSAFERRVLRGLAGEWTFAAQALSGPYRGMIRLPVFSLGEMGSRLGQWRPERFELCLSRRLVCAHPWDAVREVLHHEMAHQLAEALPGGLADPPHGPVFRQACRLLGANPRASGTYPTLHERIASGVVSEQDRMMVRIRKLLSLAQSCNPHEAEAAMLKAHHLIRKYNVDLQQTDEARSFASIFLGKPALRHFREVYHLSGLLQHYYFVQGIWVSAWVLEKSRMGRVLEISGTEANVKMADYVHAFVLRFIDDQWRRYNRGRRLNRYRKTDFAVGVIEGFGEKLARSVQQETAEEGRELVCTQDPKLARYVQQRYPRIESFRRTGGRQDPAVIEEGVRRGRELVIHRGIEKQGTGKRPKLKWEKNEP